MAFAIPVFGTTAVAVIAGTAVSFALLAVALALGFSWACQIYFRLPRRAGLGWAACAGYALLAGALLGTGLQAVYNTNLGSPAVQELALKPLCWGLLSLVILAPYRSSIPNLRPKQLLGFGFVLGGLGALLYFIPSLLIPDPLGSVLGAGTLGAVLFASLPLAEVRGDWAGVEVCWPQGFRTLFALGADPIYVGGGADHVWLPGQKTRLAGVLCQTGQVKYLDPATGKRQDLRHHSRVVVAGVALVVHQKQ